MSKDQIDTHLRYGQGILLRGYKPEKDPLEGCLTVKGFADTRGNYETVQDILYFKNYRNAIFEFLPAGNFEINDELHKLSDKVVDTEEQQRKRSSVIKTLIPRAQSEKNQFDLTIKSKKKITIKFGDYFILRHVDSDTFLSGTIRPSDGSNGAFSVEVSKKLSRFLIFQILPYRSFESQSMQIPFSSPVLIKNIANNGFLTFEKVGMSLGDKNMNKYIQRKPTQSDSSYNIPVKTNSLTSEKYQLVTHFADLTIVDQATPMPWYFQLHFKDVDNDSLIQHDIVYLQHTQNNGILAALGKDIVLKQLKEDNGEGLPFFQSLWEIQSHDQTNQAYILRHLMSGMTMGIQTNLDNQPHLPVLFDISQGKTAPLGVIELKLAKKQGGVINSDSFVNIGWKDFILDVVEEEQEEDQGFGKSSMMFEELICRKKMKKLAKNQVYYNVRKLKFSQDISKHCFVIQQIDDSLKKELLFALSFHSTIINLRQDLKWGAVQAAKRISYKSMMKVTQKIAEIIDFLKECQSDNLDKQFILPSPKRQIICKDLGLSQLLFQLLFFMRQNMHEDIFKQSANEHEKFIQMYETIYEVIINLIMDNNKFKTHVSKWIMFIIQDVIEKNEDIYFKTLMELLKDNNFFVENFLTEQLVAFLLDKMLKGRDQKQFTEKKYLEILRSFCICGGKILSSNQVIILHQFILKLKTSPIAFVYELKMILKNGEVFCLAALDKKKVRQYKFDEFQQICKSKDENGHRLYPLSWEYYSTYLNLLADLSQGRSKQIENFMTSELPLDMMTELFCSYTLNQLQVPIIKIFQYLYFENENFYPIQQQNRVIAYGLIQQEQIKVNCHQSKVSPWTTLQRVLMKILQKLQEIEPILPKFQAKNQVLYALLCITHQTLNLGFWETKQHLQIIYHGILKILEPHEEMVYEEVVKIKEQNKIMIACKIQCVNIIDLIIHQDVDMNLKILNKVFKSFQFPQTAANFSLQVTKLLEVPENTEFADQFLDLYRQSLSNYENIVKEDVFEKVLQLAKYKNAELTKLSLSLFQRVFMSQKSRLENFYYQLYICDQNSVDFHKYLNELRNKFFTLEDFNTPMITQENQSNNYFLVYQENGGVMQDLYLINELMKNEHNLQNIDKVPTLQSSNMYEILATEKLINFTNQRASSNLSKQKLVDATNIHLKILTYVKNCTSIPESELAAKLLHLCYKFLVGLIENHQQIKLTMAQYLPQIMNHLSCNIGALDFIKQMYDNNKSMLYNQQEINVLIRNICDIIENQQETYYKSKLLDFLRYLIYLNNKPLKTNQILILKIMQDDGYKKIILRPTISMIEELVAEYYESNGEQYQYPKNCVVYSPSLAYLSTFFQILVSLVDQNNKVNAGKLERNFPFDGILDMIKATKKCIFLKRNIRAFLNRLYYFSSGTNAYLSQILNEDIVYMINDLDEIISIKHRSDVSRIQNISFENPVRFTYLQTYLYLNLEEIMFTLHSIFNTKELFDQIVSYLSTISETNIGTCLNFIKIAERLGWLRNYFTSNKNVPTSAMTKFLQSRIKILLDALPVQVYQKGAKKQLGEDEKEGFKESMILKILNGNISKFYQDNSKEYQNDAPLSFLTSDLQPIEKAKKQLNWSRLSQKLREIFTRKKRQFESLDEEIHFKMDKLVAGLKTAKSIDYKLIKSFQLKLFGTNANDQLLDFIHTLIQINNEDPEILTEDLKIFILRILTSIFENTNKPITADDGETQKKQIDQWEPEDWQENEPKIQAIQIKFKKYNVGQFITALAKGNICQNIRLANCTLLCGISYLLGGNKQTQNDIRDQLNKDPENKVFKNIRALISKLGNLIRKCVDEDKAHLFQKEDEYLQDFIPTTIDNYDFYMKDEKYMTRKNVEEPHYTDQALYYQQCIITYRRVFKFLQLLCQNSNTENQNFIREQPDTSQSIDFIEIATKQLRNIFQVVISDISDVPIFILEFILEVTPIKVPANQQAFIKSSFFEDLCLLDNTLKKDNQLENRGFGKDDGPIKSILKQSILIILSNLEGGNSNNFKMLDEKLQPGFLVKLLKKKLEDAGITNKQQFDSYIEQLTAPKTVKQNGQEKLVSQTFFDEEICSILDIIVIFMKLRDVLQSSSKLYSAYQKQKVGDYEELFATLQSCLLKIQISDEAEKIQNVYFPNHPVFNSLSGGLRDYVMLNVDRGTHRQKIISLLGFVSGIKQKINQSYYFEKCQNLTEQDMMNSYQNASRLSIFLCLYIAYFYEVFIDEEGAQFGTVFPFGIIRFILGLIQFYFSVKYIYIWYKIRIWSKPQRVSRKAPGTEQQPENNPEQGQQAQPPENQGEQKKQTLLDKAKKYYQMAVQSYNSEDPKFYNSNDFYKIFLFVLVSFIGTFFYPPILFIHIMDAVCNSPILGTIFQAIGLVVNPLMLVSMMGVVFTFIFCTVTLGNYVKDLYADASEDDMCQGMIGCILGLFVSGVIGQTMSTFEITRFTYDTIYSIFFGMLFGNIVSGLMLDTFGSLRDSTDQRQSDKQNTCYICNIDRQALQKNNEEFSTHISKRHFLWNYIFYIIALEEKNPTTYTGLQYYISQKYNLPDEQMDTLWVPNGQQVKFDVKEAASKMMKKLDSSQQQLNSSVQEVEKRIEEFHTLTKSII